MSHIVSRRLVLLVALSTGLLPAADAQQALKSGVWWDPAESGWGLLVTDQGNVIAPYWYTNDVDGEPTWFVAPARPQADGSWRGDVLRFRGMPLAQIAGQSADPATTVGTASLHFEGRALRFDYRVGASTGSKTLRRFDFGGKDVVCRAATAARAAADNYSDLWWDPQTSGWGVQITHVDDALYATWYTYDEDREAIYYNGATTRQPDGRFAGTLYRSRNGTPFAAIDGAPANDGSDAVGTLSFRFDDGERGSFAYTIGAVSQTRPIRRMLFGDTAAQCAVEPYQSTDGDGGDDGIECHPPQALGDRRDIRVVSRSDGTSSVLTDRYEIVRQGSFQGQVALVEEVTELGSGGGRKANNYVGADGGDVLVSFGAEAFDPATGALLSTTVNDPLRIERPRFFEAGTVHALAWKGRATAQGFTTVIDIADRVKLLGTESVTTPAGTFDACRFEVETEVASNVSGITTRTRMSGLRWTSAQWGLVKEQTSGTTVVTSPFANITTELESNRELLSARIGGQSTP